MDRRSLFKIALVAVVVSFIGWFYASGGYKSFDPEAMRVWIRDAGAWGALLFVVSYTCLQPLGVNGLIFLLSAPLIWSATDAFFLNWAGTVGCGVVSFTIARFVAKGWVQQRLPERVRRFDQKLETRGLRTVVVLRLVFFTSPMLQYALGVSRVKTSPFLMGTVVGVAPFTLLATMLGVSINAWLDEHPISSWPWDRIGPWLVAGIVAIAAVLIVLIRRWRARPAE